MRIITIRTEYGSEQLDDEDILLLIPRNDPCMDVRQAAVRKLSPETLSDLVFADGDEQIRGLAADRTEDEQTLPEALRKKRSACVRIAAGK